MDNQQQPVLDDEQEDEYYQGASNINHRGKSAIYVVAYFALLAILMYPAHKLHLGTQGVFFAMIAAGLSLSLCLFAATWARGKLAALQLSKKEFIQLMVGYQPDNAASAAPEATAAIVTTTSPHATTGSLVPLADQRVVRYGEVVGFDEEDDELPEHLIEANPLYLSDTFQPDVNSLLGATALLCGMRRSGKSNGIAVFSEELGRYYCPLCIGDTEDEYGPLSDHRYLPRGKWAGSAALLPQMEAAGMREYVAVDLNGAYAFGQAIVRDVLQVVLHLKSYESDDGAAEIMTEIIYGMHDWEASRHNRERVPCTFILDEASKWLQQRLEKSSLDKDVLNLMQQALFGTVVRRGGKQGLGLILATQRIAELDKRALQSQWKFLGVRHPAGGSGYRRYGPAQAGEAGQARQRRLSGTPGDVPGGADDLERGPGLHQAHLAHDPRRGVRRHRDALADRPRYRRSALWACHLCAAGRVRREHHHRKGGSRVTAVHRCLQ